MESVVDRLCVVLRRGDLAGRTAKRGGERVVVDRDVDVPGEPHHTQEHRVFGQGDLDGDRGEKRGCVLRGLARVLGAEGVRPRPGDAVRQILVVLIVPVCDVRVSSGGAIVTIFLGPARRHPLVENGIARLARVTPRPTGTD